MDDPGRVVGVDRVELVLLDVDPDERGNGERDDPDVGPLAELR